MVLQFIEPLQFRYFISFAFQSNSQAYLGMRYAFPALICKHAWAYLTVEFLFSPELNVVVQATNIFCLLQWNAEILNLI